MHIVQARVVVCHRRYACAYACLEVEKGVNMDVDVEEALQGHVGGLALSQAVEDGDEGVVVHGGGLPCKGEAGGVVREFDGVHGVMVEGPMRAQRIKCHPC